MGWCRRSRHKQSGRSQFCNRLNVSKEFVAESCNKSFLLVRLMDGARYASRVPAGTISRSRSSVNDFESMPNAPGRPQSIVCCVACAPGQLSHALESRVLIAGTAAYCCARFRLSTNNSVKVGSIKCLLDLRSKPNISRRQLLKYAVASC